MAVVIRLQGLPVIAGSVDIRHFFTGLRIPDGGVHIIGGKLGEAFIIFATDEDARRAMSRTGGIIKNSHIQLFLSSKTEMQNILEMSRKGNKGSNHPTVPATRDMALSKGTNQNKFEQILPESSLGSGAKYESAYLVNQGIKEANSDNDPEDVYIFFYGLPYGTTEEDIREFFYGLEMVDMVFFTHKNGKKMGSGIVKFGSINNANAAMERNNEYIGKRYVCLKKTTERQWIAANTQFAERKSKKEKTRSRSRSPQNQHFYIHLKNLSSTVEKREIKSFLGVLNMADSQIKFLLDKQRNRTREGFVMLRAESQYEKCLSLHKSKLSGRPVFILPISRKAVLELIESYARQTPPRQESSLEDNSNNSKKDPPGVKKCIYLRNFPVDVTKAEVQKFFSRFPVKNEDIFLLFDSRGVGLGEALVMFPSENQAVLAESLNRQRFLGTEVLLSRITEEQMKKFSASIRSPLESVLAHKPVYREQYVKHNLPESFNLPFSLPSGVAYGRSDFKRSLETVLVAYPEQVVGQNKQFGRFNIRNKSTVDYHHFPPIHQSFEPRLDGAVIHMKNVPYTATTQEILDFFYGYNINPDSVSIKFNSVGMATGLATVFFENYNEALTAVNELNERPIGIRKIGLRIQRKTCASV